MVHGDGVWVKGTRAERDTGTVYGVHGAERDNGARGRCKGAG